MTSQTPVLLTPDQVAIRLGVKRRHVYQMCADGRLPGHKISARMLRVVESDLNELIENSRISTAKESAQ